MSPISGPVHYLIEQDINTAIHSLTEAQVVRLILKQRLSEIVRPLDTQNVHLALGLNISIIGDTVQALHYVTTALPSYPSDTLAKQQLDMAQAFESLAGQSDGLARDELVVSLRCKGQTAANSQRLAEEMLGKGHIDAAKTAMGHVSDFLRLWDYIGIISSMAPSVATSSFSASSLRPLSSSSSTDDSNSDRSRNFSMGNPPTGNILSMPHGLPLPNDSCPTTLPYRKRKRSASSSSYSCAPNKKPKSTVTQPLTSALEPSMDDGTAQFSQSPITPRRLLQRIPTAGVPLPGTLASVPRGA